MRMKSPRRTYTVYDAKDGRWLDHEYSNNVEEAYTNAKKRWNRPIILELIANTPSIEVRSHKTSIDIRDIFGKKEFEVCRIGKNGILLSIKEDGYRIEIYGGIDAFGKFCKAVERIKSYIEDIESTIPYDMGPFHYHIPKMSSAPTRLD